jgi:uncharacterized protein (DUF4415 family)
MSNSDSEFPFGSARRISREEVAAAQRAVQEQFGIEVGRRGRPLKAEDEKAAAISIRLHPQVLRWAKAEGEKRGVGYQTVINEELLRIAGRAD